MQKTGHPIDLAFDEFSSCPSADKALSLSRIGQTLKVGFLFKRSKCSGRESVWRRRYFIVSSLALFYYRGWDRGWRGIALADCSVAAVSAATLLGRPTDRKDYGFALEQPHQTVLVRNGVPPCVLLSLGHPKLRWCVRQPR